LSLTQIWAKKTVFVQALNRQSGIKMEPQPERDELYSALTENAHLKETLRALREELEKLTVEKEERVQKAVVTANNEVVQLKAIAAALRDQMEKMEYDKSESIQNALANANDEIIQLKTMAIALREELERSRIAYEENVQKIKRLHATRSSSYKRPLKHFVRD